MADESRFYQNVRITFDDGRTGVFSGKAIMTAEEHAAFADKGFPFALDKMEFYPPKELPEDCEFCDLAEPFDKDGPK